MSSWTKRGGIWVVLLACSLLSLACQKTAAEGVVEAQPGGVAEAPQVAAPAEPEAEDPLTPQISLTQSIRTETSRRI